MTTGVSSISDTPKLPFIIGDIVFFGIALTIIGLADDPLSTGTLAIATGCVIIAIALLITPFLLDYEARLRIAEAKNRSLGESHLRKLSALSEQLNHAVSRSQSIEDEVGKALGATEEITEKLTLQSSDLTQLLATGESPSKASNEQLASITSDLNTLLQKFDTLQKSIAENQIVNVPINAPQSSSVSPPTERSKTPAKPSRQNPVAPQKSQKKASKKPQTSVSTETTSASVDEPSPEIEEISEPTAPSSEEEPLESNEGETSITATAYVGIGNKLYLRGEGAGLSWEKGTPLQFLAIGKWGWSTSETDQPISCHLYKNDEEPALDGKVTVQPGEKVELSPRF
jgi:hypothetical protein